MGGATLVYNENNFFEVSFDFPFTAYLFNSNYEKSAKCNPTFLRDDFFSIFPKYWQVSKYTSLLSKLSFRKEGKNNSNFWMVNLCNGGAKEFLELWEIIHLNIWTQLT